MPAFEIKSRLIPHKILTIMLYGSVSDVEWLEPVSRDSVRIYTGNAARGLRMKNNALWEALYWLEEQKLIKKVKKEKKRGTCVIVLKQPSNLKVGE